MLKTVMPFAVKGFIWYQGSANVARAEEQKKLFPAMVKDWRKSWGNDNLPFYFVQLPRYERNNWHAFRDAQRKIDEKLTNSSTHDLHHLQTYFLGLLSGIVSLYHKFFSTAHLKKHAHDVLALEHRKKRCALKVHSQFRSLQYLLISEISGFLLFGGL